MLAFRSCGRCHGDYVRSIHQAQHAVAAAVTSNQHLQQQTGKYWAWAPSHQHYLPDSQRMSNKPHVPSKSCQWLYHVVHFVQRHMSIHSQQRACHSHSNRQSQTQSSFPLLPGTVLHVRCQSPTTAVTAVNGTHDVIEIQVRNHHCVIQPPKQQIVSNWNQAIL